MRVLDFIKRGLRSPQPPLINNERIKAQASALQSLGLAVLGVAVLTPFFNPAFTLRPGGLPIGGFVGGLLLFAAQWRLAYIVDTGAGSVAAKEAKDGR